MMTDTLDIRLTDVYRNWDGNEAAKKIQRLQAEKETLREALRRIETTLNATRDNMIDERVSDNLVEWSIFIELVAADARDALEETKE